MQVRMRGISIVVGLVLAGGVSAVTPSDGTGQVLAADTPSITDDGNGFIAPAGCRTKPAISAWRDTLGGIVNTRGVANS